MNSKILLSVLALAFLAQLAESSPESILKELANIKFTSQGDLASKCETYEKYIDTNYPKLMAMARRDGGRIQGLLHVLQMTKHVSETGLELAFINQLKECAELVARLESKHAGPADPNNELRAVRVEFDSVGLAKLSKARQDVKSLPLDRRCETYDEVLREILAGQEAARESKPVLFRSALRALAARQVPFQQGQAPFVETLVECVSKLSAFQDEPTTPRTVIAGPVHPREHLGPVEVNPVENMRNEFNQVKKNAVDYGQDLYAGPPGSEDELNYRPSETDDEIEYGIDVDVPPPSPESSGFEIDSNERYRSHSSGQHGGLMNQYILDDTYDEMARKERDPVKKLELLLELERRENKRLLQQLDDNQYEIGDLKEQNVQLKKVLGTSHSGSTKSNPLEESRLFEMKRLYEQASEREQRTNEKYEHLLRKYEDLEARFMLERTMGEDKYADTDDDDDDDDDDDENDHDDRDGDDKELKKWLKKDKKALEKQEKKAKKAEEEFRKEEEKAAKKLEKEMKKSVEKTEDGEKIYRDPVDMARKLQNRMKSSEAPEQRCQKYYALLNHPGKVTKKLLKLIAKLNLPRASIHDSEYFSSLNYYADLLSRSDNKDAREASAEMRQCLQTRSVDIHHSMVPTYHHGYEVNSDYEIEDQYPSEYTDNYDGGLLGGNYFQHNKRSLLDRISSTKPKASAYEIPVEFVTNPTNSKRKSLLRGDSNKYAAYGHAAASVDGATAFARFGPSSKLAQFQAEHY